VDVKKEEEIEATSTDDETPMKKRLTRPKSLKKEKTPVKVKVKEEEIEPTSNDDEPMKKKRGRPRGSTKLLTKEKNQMDVDIKEEVEPTLNNNIAHVTPTKNRPGRPRSSTKSLSKATKQINMEIKEEEVEPTLNNDDEKLDIPIKKTSGRARNSSKLLNKNKTQVDIKIKEEVITPARRGRKRKSVIEGSNNDEEFKPDEHEESSTDNANLSIRRSSRPRKAPALEPTSAVASLQV
jgi:hypothetical protein